MERKIRELWLVILAVTLALLLRECLAMAHGARKWSNVGADETVYGLADMAELAARLGSVDTFNREGNVLFIETFEHGLSSWESGLYGTGAEAIISAEHYRSSGYSAKLIGGSDGDAAVKIFRKFPYPVLGRYGLEFSVLFEAHTDMIKARLVYHDGTYDHLFVINYSLTDNDLTLEDEDGVEQTIASDLDLHPGYAPFQTFKLVANLSSDEYLRLIVNETEYDISAYSCKTQTTDDAPNVRVDILIYSEAGYNGFSYVDDLILTQNEPP